MKSVLKNKQGQLNALSGSIIFLVIGIIVLVMGVVVVQEMRDTQAAGSEAFDAANESLVGLGDFSDFIPLIVIAIAASVVIGLIIAGFGFGGRER